MSTLYSNIVQKIKKVITHKNPIRYFFVHTYKRALGFLFLTFPKLIHIYQPKIQRNNYSLLMTPTLFSVLLYRHPDMKREDEEVLFSLLKEGDVFVDVGANIGTTTIPMAYTVGSTGKVISFEAHPLTAKNLQKSVNQNKGAREHIEIRNKALGEKNGVTHISNLAMDDLNFLSDKGIEVELSTLDTELRDIPHINLIKIDVEGYEKFVFLGGEKTLAKTDMIYFESFEPNYARFDYTLDDILTLLHKASFIVYSLNDGKRHEIREGYRNLETYENLLAVKRK